MLPYSMLFPVDKSAKTPVFLQISAAVTDNIRRGVLTPGTRLPGTRALATALQLHRKTVVAAYEELLAQGWLETQLARGTFVSKKLPEAAPEALRVPSGPAAGVAQKPGFAFQKNTLLEFPVLKGVNTLAFNDGFPDLRLAPWDALSRAYRTVLRHGYRKNLFSYSDTFGETALRAAMADYLRESRGLPIGVENVLLTRGSVMAMHLVAQSVLQAGEVVVVGEIGYATGNLVFRHAGARLVTVPVDERGLDVEALERLCRDMPVRMVYVTPHHHYPTTVSMPAERRLQLLRLARTHGFCILEDDYDFDFHYDSNPVLPLASADEGRHVVYVGSLSKVFSPALRVGYVVAPAEVIEGLANLRRIIDRQGDNLQEAALAVLFREGDMRRHLKKAQKTYHRRRDLFCELLRSEVGHVVEFTKPGGGLAVWARFDRAFPLPELAKKARAIGLWISDGVNYGTQLNAARLGFAAVNETEIERGMGILKRIVEQFSVP